MFDSFKEELELKYKADGLNDSQFVDFCYGLVGFKDHKTALGCPDHYFVNSDNDVVRYREDTGLRDCLTVKCRASANSITSRHEVDLFLQDKPGLSQVTQFLKLMGFKKLFTIVKNSLICTYTPTGSGQPVLVFALYDVAKVKKDYSLSKKQRYFEVEIEKGTYLTKEEGLKELVYWKAVIEADLKLGAPLNKSIYEIFTKNTYKVRK
jgi:hypothetical protein